MVIALRGVGLDPGIAISHLDRDRRSSLALDAIEAVRPYVDFWLASWLAASQTITAANLAIGKEGKLPHGAVEIDGVPVHGGCGNKAETGGAEALVLKREVTDLTLAIEEHRAAHRIAGLALFSPAWLCCASRGLTANGLAG
jgi:hypothetical protein